MLVCFSPNNLLLDNKKTWTNNFVYAYRGIAKHLSHINE